MPIRSCTRGRVNLYHITQYDRIAPCINQRAHKRHTEAGSLTQTRHNSALALKNVHLQTFISYTTPGGLSTMLLANRYYDDSARHATLPSPPMPIPYTQANKYPVPSRIQERRRGRAQRRANPYACVVCTKLERRWKNAARSQTESPPKNCAKWCVTPLETPPHAMSCWKKTKCMRACSLRSRN
jgi:hypothetical protein